jgi:hypothetical protein
MNFKIYYSRLDIVKMVKSRMRLGEHLARSEAQKFQPESLKGGDYFEDIDLWTLE